MQLGTSTFSFGKPALAMLATMEITLPKLRRLLTLGRVAALGLIAMAGTSAVAATRTYIVTDYDSIRVEGPLEVTVQTGRGASARGEGDRAALDALQLTVSARILTVRFRSSVAGAPVQGDRGAVRLTLTAPTLRRVQLTGSGLLRADGLARGGAQISTLGSGRVEISGIDSDDLELAQRGAGSAALSGRTRNAQIRLSGNGSLDARDLQVTDLDLAIDGAATAEASAERTAKVMLVGSGSATVIGRPACTVRQAGSGIVRCGENAR